jgi:hypothetical protein
MLTSLECLTKADEMEARGLACSLQSRRDGYANVARGWRRTAVLAHAQEQWEALRHPISN